MTVVREVEVREAILQGQKRRRVREQDARLAANQAHQELVEHPESQEDPASPVLPVCPVAQESLQLPHVNRQHHHHASHAPLDLLAHQDQLVHLVMLEDLVILELLVLMVDLAKLDQRGLLALLENPEHQDSPGNLDRQEQVNIRMVSQELLETRDLQAHQETQEHQVPMLDQDLPDHPVLLVLVDSQAQMDSQDSQDLLASLEEKEKKEFAPSTVLSMAVSSLRMEQDVKKINQMAEPLHFVLAFQVIAYVKN